MSDSGHDPEANPWQRRSRRVAYANPWITVFEDDVIRPDGAPGIYGVVHFPGRAIGILPVNADGQVVLVGQYRYALGLYSWEIPEGAAGADEEPLVAAQRELLEETGLSAGDWRELARAHLSNSVSDEEAILFLATDLRAGMARPDGTERLQVRSVPFAQALEMVVEGRITDAMSVIAIERRALLERIRT